MTKETRGGSRPGSGRPKKEKTVVLSYRVAKRFADLIDKKIRELIKKPL